MQATSKSLRASSSELADETAALLAQALTENTDTTDTEVTTILQTTALPGKSS